MISVSSAFAVAPTSADEMFAKAIATDQGVKPKQVRVMIVKGKKELESAKTSIKLLSIRIDKRFDNFYANVRIDDSADFEVNGKFEKVTRIPVLSRKITRDEIITAADITYMDVNEKLLVRGIVTDEKQLIGKGVAKTVFPQKAIMPSSLTAAKFISRGATVTTVFKNNLLTIESTAVALEDGAEGEVIRLKNPDSNRVIRGTVTEQNRVIISDNIKQVASN